MEAVQDAVTIFEEVEKDYIVEDRFRFEREYITSVNPDPVESREMDWQEFFTMKKDFTNNCRDFVSYLIYRSRTNTTLSYTELKKFLEKFDYALKSAFEECENDELLVAQFMMLNSIEHVVSRLTPMEILQVSDSNEGEGKFCVLFENVCNSLDTIGHHNKPRMLNRPERHAHGYRGPIQRVVHNIILHFNYFRKLRFMDHRRKLVDGWQELCQKPRVQPNPSRPLIKTDYDIYGRRDYFYYENVHRGNSKIYVCTYPEPAHVVVHDLVEVSENTVPNVNLLFRQNYKFEVTPRTWLKNSPSFAEMSTPQMETLLDLSVEYCNAVVFLRKEKFKPKSVDYSLEIFYLFTKKLYVYLKSDPDDDDKIENLYEALTAMTQMVTQFSPSEIMHADNLTNRRNLITYLYIMHFLMFTKFRKLLMVPFLRSAMKITHVMFIMTTHQLRGSMQLFNVKTQSLVSEYRYRSSETSEIRKRLAWRHRIRDSNSHTDLLRNVPENCPACKEKMENHDMIVVAECDHIMCIACLSRLQASDQKCHQCATEVVHWIKFVNFPELFSRIHREVIYPTAKEMELVYRMCEYAMFTERRPEEVPEQQLEPVKLIVYRG